LSSRRRRRRRRRRRSKARDLLFWGMSKSFFNHNSREI